MADKIEIFDSKQAFDDLGKLSTTLKGIEKQIVDMANSASKMNSSLSGLSSILDLEARLNKVETAQKKATTSMSEYEKVVLALAKAKEKLSISGTEAYKNLQKTNKELSNVNSEIKRTVKSYAEQEKANKIANSAYLKLNAALNKLKTAYRDLQVKQELGQKLTLKEEVRLKSLSEKVLRLDAVLKKTDAGMGVHTRSVGNYSKAFDSLGFSVAQMTREAPAFLVSMNTGFMALSNNIPIFVDEVQRAVIANKELTKAQAAGQRLNEKNVPIWKQLSNAVFSWQSALSAGIVVMTVFMPKVINYINEMFRTERAVDGAAKALEQFNKVMKESEVAVTNDLTKLGLLDNAVKNTNLSNEERLTALKEIKSEYGGYLKNMTDEEILTKGVGDNYLTIADNILLMAKVKAAADRITEIATEKLELETKNRVLSQSKESAEILKSVVSWGDLYQAINQYTTIKHESNMADVRTTINKNKLNQLTYEEAKLYTFLNENLSTYLKQFEDKGDGNKETRERVELLKQEQEAMFGSIQYLEEQIALMEKLAKLATDETSRDIFERQAKGYKDVLNALVNFKNEYEDLIDITPKADISENQKAIDELFKKSGLSAKIFSEELAKYMSDPTKNIDDFIDRLKEVEEAINGLKERMKESFEQFTETTNMFFDNRIEKLAQDRDANEEYYDNLIELAEGNEEEQEALEYAKEARDKELRQKQNETAKKQAAFNKALAVADIAVKLGQTIVAANLAAKTMDGISFGVLGEIYKAIEIPLAISLAAAQTAAVMSAPVPQFKFGKPESNNYEGIALVNDGGKTEYREDKFGNISAFKGTNVLTHVAKDDIIHKDLNSLISSKGYDSNEIYKATVLASLASGSGISTNGLEKVLDSSLKGIKNDIRDGLSNAFKKVNIHNKVIIDNSHNSYRNNKL